MMISEWIIVDPVLERLVIGQHPLKSLFRKAAELEKKLSKAIYFYINEKDEVSAHDISGLRFKGLK